MLGDNGCVISRAKTYGKRIERVIQARAQGLDVGLLSSPASQKCEVEIVPGSVFQVIHLARRKEALRDSERVRYRPNVFDIHSNSAIAADRDHRHFTGMTHVEGQWLVAISLLGEEGFPLWSIGDLQRRWSLSGESTKNMPEGSPNQDEPLPVGATDEAAGALVLVERQ